MHKNEIGGTHVTINNMAKALCKGVLDMAVGTPMHLGPETLSEPVSDALARQLASDGNNRPYGWRGHTSARHTSQTQ